MGGRRAFTLFAAFLSHITMGHAAFLSRRGAETGGGQYEKGTARIRRFVVVVSVQDFPSVFFVSFGARVGNHLTRRKLRFFSRIRQLILWEERQ